MFARWLLVFILVLPGLAAAQELQPIPNLQARVTDSTGTLSSGQVAGLENKLAAFEQEKGSQLAVLIVPTTKPEEIEQYSIRVAENWKIGRSKVDDGVILVIAKNDHRMRIEVGYGLEGAIPDAKAKRIIDETLTPHFRNGDFYGGIDAACDQLMGLIKGEDLPAPSVATSLSGDGIGGAVALIWITALLVLIRSAIREGQSVKKEDFLFSGVAGGIVGLIGGTIAASFMLGLALAVFVFLLLLMRTSPGIWVSGRGYGGGFGGGSSGGGFSGGGGGFGGGGASGGW